MTVTQRFSTEEAARDYFETLRWPNGPVCAHCGNAAVGRIYKVTENRAQENPGRSLQVRRVRAGVYRDGRDRHGGHSPAAEQMAHRLPI